MNGVRPCGREGCRICAPVPIFEEPKSDTLAMLLLSAAMLAGFIVFAFVLLPVLSA